MNPNKNDDMRRYADMMDRKRRRHDEPGDGMPRVDAESPEQAAEEPKKPLSDEEHARAALRKFTEVETDPDRVDVSLRSILGGDILAGAWFRRQFFFILMLVAFIIVYVSNRYASQQELLEIDEIVIFEKIQHVQPFKMFVEKFAQIEIFSLSEIVDVNADVKFVAEPLQGNDRLLLSSR